MAGQPNFPGWLVFNVADQQVTEPAGALTPASIVPVNGPFDVIATFTGSGLIWGWLTGFGNVEYTMKFFAESIGPYAHDVDLGTVTGTLVPGQNNYQVRLHVHGGIEHEGYYEVACRVTFPGCRGMSGHCDHPLYLEVAP